MTQENKSQIIITVTVFALVFFVGSIWYDVYLQNANKKGSISQSNTSSFPAVKTPSQVVPAQPKTPVVTMKTYVNDEQGYSFSYPSSWSVAPNKYAGSSDIFFGPNATEDLASIGDINVSGYTSIDAFLNDTDLQLKDKKDITIDGVVATRARAVGVSTHEAVFFMHDGSLYHISLNPSGSDDMTLFDQLVSSFRFVDKKALVPGADKTYTNKDVGIEFTYPDNATIDTTSIQNGLWVTLGTVLKMQVNKYNSIADLGKYTNVSEYFKDRESAKLMSDPVKTSLGGQIAYKYVDHGITNVYTVLVSHADGSVHIISFPMRETRAELSPAELSMLLSIVFLE